MTLAPEQDTAVRAIVAEMIGKVVNGADQRSRATDSMQRFPMPATSLDRADIEKANRRADLLELALPFAKDAASAVHSAGRFRAFIDQSTDRRDRGYRYAALATAVQFAGASDAEHDVLDQVLAAAAVFYGYVWPQAGASAHA